MQKEEKPMRRFELLIFLGFHKIHECANIYLCRYKTISYPHRLSVISIA